MVVDMFDAKELTRECRQAAAADPSLAADDELLVAVVEVQSARSALEVAEGRLLAELQVRGTTERCFGLKTAGWVAAQAKVDRRAVARRLRTARWVRRLDAVIDAVADGSITGDHAAVLAEQAANPRVGDQVEATVPVWVELARSTSFADWSHQVRRTVALLDQDGGYNPADDVARNRLRLTPMPDGSVTISGELNGHDALVVRQGVEAHADRMFHWLRACQTPDNPLPNRATLLAMALADLIRRGLTVDPETSTGPAADVSLVITARPTDPDEPEDSTEGSEACRGWASRSSWRGDCGPACTPDDGHVHRDVAAILLCDPAITAMVVDTLGVPLDMGRKIRLANQDQRRAVGRRDGGCVFPGCDAPIGWCDVHHVVWWTRDGLTDCWNLALLCRHHHGLAHRRGWSMTTTGDHWFTWTTPSGTTLHSQRHRGRSPTIHPDLQHPPRTLQPA